MGGFCMERILTPTNYELIPLNDLTNVRFYTSVDTGSYIASHWHDAVEIIYLLEGELMITVENSSFRISAGQCVMITPNQIHSTLCTRPNRAIVFQIPVAFMEKFIPDVKQMLHLSNGQLGTVLFAIPIGQLLMMAFSGILVSRFGSKKMLVLSEVLYVLVLFCIGSSTTVFHLILSLIAFGMMANLMNIATNTQACLVEKMYGRNIMSSFHGLWSLGGFSGGIIGAIFANTLLPIDVHFGTILALSILIVAVGFRSLINDAMAKAEEEDVPKFSFKTIDPILFLLGLMGFAGMFCEGTVYDWSSVYFSSVVKPDEAFIRAGYVAGMGAMTLGRFMADGFVTKYGPARVLKVCGGLILGGLWLAAALPYLIPATLGFLLVGFGISSSVPICYSIAGKLGTIKASIAITIVSSISFFGFLVGPPVIGWLAEATGLRIAISIAACLGLMIAFVAAKVGKRLS